MAIVNGQASTLEQIAARLKEINEGAADISKLLVVFHEASGLSFRVGPMSRADYEGWQNIKAQEVIRHQASGVAEAPINCDKSDAWILTHAVFSEGSEKLNDALAALLLNGRGFGPSTHILCEAAASKNPPRAELARELQMMWGLCREMIVFLRLVTNGRKESEVTDFLVGTPEEKAVAARSLGKIEETLPFWEGVFEAQDAAQNIGVDFYSQSGGEGA